MSPQRLPRAALEWLLSGDDRDLPRLRPTELHIRCAECRAGVYLRGIDRGLLDQQMGLYRAGWRQEPSSGKHYCPDHVPPALAALGGRRD